MEKEELLNLQDRASSGHIDSIINLIDFYIETKDYKSAYQTACRFDFFADARGYKILGQFYQNGVGTDIDLSKAISYYEKSLKMGEISSGYNLALIYIKNKEYDKAINYLASGLENGHTPSIRLLATMYQKGEGVCQSEEIATNLFNKAADLGDIKAIDQLGRFYYSKQDYATSYSYFVKGAERNDPDSIYHLALCYAKGLGTKQDFSKAFHYYELGAKLDEPRCLYNLSIYYRDGIIVKQNQELAYKLEQLAIQKGFKK